MIVGKNETPGGDRRSTSNKCGMVATLTKVNQKHTLSPVNASGRPGAIEATGMLLP